MPPRPPRLRHPTLLCALGVWAAWLVLITLTHNWHLFRTGWPMSLTMAFGSFVAGATSEGSGAVAFPVMTLGFDIAPAVARDFALTIQSVGMTSAAFTIFCLRIPVVWPAVLWGSVGGAIGVALGLDVVSPLLPAVYTKLFFVSFWLSFAGALYLINRDHGRAVYSRLDPVTARHAGLLVGAGVLGGIVSGTVGSGLDILVFALLVLGFRIDETVATPTSVVLMGLNALVAVLWREGVTGGMAAEAWSYWLVCVPIVVLAAPAGVRFIHGRSRRFVVGFLYLSIAAQFVAALLILPMTPPLVAFSLGVLTAGLAVFHAMTVLGRRRLASLGPAA